MNFFVFHDANGWFLLPVLTAHLVLGTGLGIIHFGAIWRRVRLVVRDQSAMRTIVLAADRLVLTGAALLLVSFEGVLPLLAVVSGLLIGRWIVIRAVQEVLL